MIKVIKVVKGRDDQRTAMFEWRGIGDGIIIKRLRGWGHKDTAAEERNFSRLKETSGTRALSGHAQAG